MIKGSDYTGSNFDIVIVFMLFFKLIIMFTAQRSDMVFKSATWMMMVVSMLRIATPL